MNLFDLYSETWDKYGYLDQHVVMEMLIKVKEHYKGGHRE